ncbi:20897_t:CDS:2 [Entrophospora sp. SA101]|nr:20897_t:CDS:2 [Entrophospora sp. SA101]CAJ0893943.1 415_t:CDS:2 [Entrophospora sp. SA101]
MSDVDTAITNCQNDFDFNQRASWIIFGGQEIILDKKSKKSMKLSNDDNTIDQDKAARNYNPQNPTQLYQDLNSVSNLYPNSPNPTPNFYPNNPNPPPASLYQNRQLNTSDRQLLPPKRHNTLSSTSHNQNSYLRSKSHPQLRPLPKPPGADESQIPQIPQIPIIPNSSSITPIQPLSTPIRQQQLFQQFPDHQQRPKINDSRYVSQTPKRSSTSSRFHQPFPPLVVDQNLPYQSLRSNSLPSVYKPKELFEQELSVAPPVPSISGSSGDNNEHSIPDSLIPGALSSLENGSKTALERFIHTYGNVTPESPSFRYSDVQPLPKPKSNDDNNVNNDVTDKNNENNYDNKNSINNSINNSDNAKNVKRLRPKSAHSVKGEASPKYNVPSSSSRQTIYTTK